MKCSKTKSAKPSTKTAKMPKASTKLPKDPSNLIYVNGRNVRVSGKPKGV